MTKENLQIRPKKERPLGPKIRSIASTSLFRVTDELREVDRICGSILVWGLRTRSHRRFANVELKPAIQPLPYR